MPVVSQFWLCDFLPEGAGRKTQGSGHRVYSVEGFLLKPIGGFRKWWVFPPNHPFWSGFPLFSPSILGYPYFWKPPYTPKKWGAQVFFVKNYPPWLRQTSRHPSRHQKRHGTMVWPWHALQNLRQELENEQSRSSEVSAKLEELEATQEKNRWGFSCVFLQGVLRTFVFASFCAMLCISIKCFVQILKWWNEHEMYSPMWRRFGGQKFVASLMEEKKAQLQRSTEAFEEAGCGSPKSSKCWRRFFLDARKERNPRTWRWWRNHAVSRIFLCCPGCQSVIFSFRPFLEGTAKGIEAGADYDSINQHIMCFCKKNWCVVLFCTKTPREISTFLYQNTFLEMARIIELTSTWGWLWCEQFLLSSFTRSWRRSTESAANLMPNVNNWRHAMDVG